MGKKNANANKTESRENKLTKTTGFAPFLLFVQLMFDIKFSLGRGGPRPGQQINSSANNSRRIVLGTIQYICSVPQDDLKS